MTKDNEIPGLENARGWYASIVEMVERLEAARNGGDEDRESVEQEIHESVLSVEVRGGWYSYGAIPDAPVEYRILLTTGGPALQIVGTLSEHGEPETAELESQDWFKPWTRVPATALTAHDLSHAAADEYVKSTLLTFVHCFYFGE